MSESVTVYSTALARPPDPHESLLHASTGAEQLPPPNSVITVSTIPDAEVAQFVIRYRPANAGVN